MHQNRSSEIVPILEIFIDFITILVENRSDKAP
jgi:hypothetical protein